ncbi:uncharacterized protein LOC128268140 [Anopheles cruzii]|uniref:uncharacterized protein LOC128268140 n=1 Tax=Anopheles cruzii TaxID=68878 RepID=UPI0022EC298D|nr:uncharacterized protein LOC128268140 [Anopheles cruzii]
MDMKSEILKRLSNPERSYAENLAYGIKLWKSSSFYYMSKYDVIFTFFLDGVTAFFRELGDLDEQQFNERWQIVNSFLSLPCPSNALPATIVERLKNVLSDFGQEIPGRREQLLESLLTSAFDTKYKNFYKFDYVSYGKILRVTLEYYKKCLKEVRPKEDEEKTIDRIFDDVKIYLKSATDDTKWTEAFSYILTPLSEVVLLLKMRGIDRHEQLLEFFKQVYFGEGKASSYNRVTDQTKRHLFMGCFDMNELPLHVIALLIEGYLRAYREMKLEVLLFLKYFLLHAFVDEQRSILKSTHQIFTITKHVFALLRKYFIKVDQQQVMDFNFTDIFTVKLKEFIDICASSDSLLKDLFELICTINDYNPLILEHTIVGIILKTMFLRKDSETLHHYQGMLISTMRMYMKLNKNEHFRTELFGNLADYLEENELDAVIRELRGKGSGKRKSKVCVGDSDTPLKKKKLQNGSAQPIVTISDDERMFLDFLIVAEKGSGEGSKPVARIQLQNLCPALAFAWPDTDGLLSNAMMEYMKVLLSGRSFEYWDSMMGMLKEAIETPPEEQTESSIFLLELTMCWMCYFFAGNTLIEHSNLFWEKLTKHFEEFDETLANFARSLLLGEQSGDGRCYSAFLQTAYFYANYRLMVRYYRPDSIEVDESQRMHAYLGEDEWATIEERLPTKDAPLMNRVLLQKHRERELVGDEIAPEERQTLVDRVTGGQTGENLRWVLLDRSTNVWFLSLLDPEQQAMMAVYLVDRAYCPLEEIKHILKEISTNHGLVEIFLLAAYKRIAENVLAACENAVCRKVSFDKLVGQNESDVLPRLRKLLVRCASNRSEELKFELTDVAEMEHLLAVLDEIEINEIPTDRKEILVALNMVLYADISALGNEQLAGRFMNQLMLHISVGTVANVSKFASIQTLIALFGQSPLLAAILKQLATNLTEEAFEEFRTILGSFTKDDTDRFALLLLMFNFLQKNNANKLKLVNGEAFGALLDDFVTIIDGFVLKKLPKQLRNSDAVCFDHCLEACLLSIRYKASRKKELDEKLRDQLLIYIEQACKVSSSSSSNLLTTCLQYKAYLKLDDARLTAILENRWQEFMKMTQEDTLPNVNSGHVNVFTDDKPLTNSEGRLQEQNLKMFVVSFTSHLSGAEYAKKLQQLDSAACGSGLKSVTSLGSVMRAFAILAKLGFNESPSAETNQAFVRSFTSVVARDVMGLCVSKKFLDEPELLLEILSSFAAVVGRPQIKLLPNAMDHVLEFLSAINIRKYPLLEGEEQQFYKLHRLISEVLYMLLMMRPNYVSHRLPQYLHVMQGQIGSIICYKESFPAAQSLNSFEVLSISDLLMPVEKMMNTAVRKLEKDLRILAPYALAQILHTIIQSKRPSTQQELIARKVYNVCFELISCYDSHSSEYLLRTMDESSRLLYTDVVKQYKKYRSFKGVA